MSKNTPAQESLQLATPDGGTTHVEKYEFEPIKGYPMLNWRGKRPFTSTQYYPAQLKEIHGEEVDGWRNKIFWGDNLQVMSHLLKQFRGKVDLVYIDPPFDSKADYKLKIKVKGQKYAGDSSAIEEKQYSDIWTNDEFLQFIYERLALIRELLSEDGTIILHCDSTKGHHIRCILDELFGDKNFINEIIWSYRRWPSNSKNFQQMHDNLFWYAKKKDSNRVFNKEYEEASESYMKRFGGKTQILDAESGTRKITSEEDTKGMPMRDVWDISIIAGVGAERTGYPTQKPEELLERIVRTCSNPGQLVFDCFMGSGTTQAVAMKLGRRFIGADINLGAIQTTTKRLIKVAEELRQKPLNPDTKYYTGFEVYNVNHYDIFRNPVQAKELLLEALEVQKLEFSTVFDGEKDGRMIKIMPVNRIATRADLNELIAGFDYKAWERKQNESPNRPVEKITLVCMGHEPDLAAQLELAAKPFKIDVEVVDILRDKANLEFKRDSEAKVVVKNGELVIERFYPMNLLQKLSLQKESVEDWKELVESVLIDWNYDGAVLQPAVVDIPGKNEMVKGRYKVPEDAGTIRVKITDLLSESWEGSVAHGD
ncbi:site-specific DNA-methyltransferase (adenine-specific)/adenine-specific DNA-methyltransferase [Sulfuritortus calidifontis]|uniref:site-specific DNA-methyltransferase (adenine-specific) n=1 Tax=Sulfuritortus calidifontis TaxID=1914471 RepID=A0A4R3JU97_9PROT|nr:MULTISPECIES: site-specific DNA-methyltransferase [Betaproteobacteria]KOF53387.1 DNA methylase [Achromobacter sp. DMS1]KOF55499.1 DNA methylase [Achromobacter sp. DMS1]TCS71184.1 site-specific DNA-methyltransferase (adenine-specific)/adenine-specific DNA-methyltransferase [Sulfuritortus calidifontis]